LIAQLGKNYTDGANTRITGKELVELAWTVIEDAQYMLGGMVVFLEAENEEKLLAFYKANRFSQFDTRQTASDANEPHELVQLLRLL
ncbi:MAG: GNAT family acetyltransferase, partial [bacterium]|nr:GNAT family acetyltransferase [bacterium]